MKKTLISRMVATIICVVVIASTPMAASAHEVGNLIESTQIVAEGYLEDGTPYTLYIVSDAAAHINIVDSVKYEMKVVYPWGTNPPETMDVSIPMNGGTYKGTLKLTAVMRNWKEYRYDAYYSGTLIGRI